MKEHLETYISGFQILTEEEIRLVVDESTVKAFSKGTILLREGQIATNCYLVLKGCIREYYLKDGEDRSTAFFLEGDSVSSFTSQQTKSPSKRTLECVEDCILTVGSQQLEVDMCKKIPRLESMILQEVERVTGQKQDELATFITSSPEERYIHLLETKPELLHRIPQHQIASYLGIKPQSLSRLKKRIQTKG